MQQWCDAPVPAADLVPGDDGQVHHHAPVDERRGFLDHCARSAHAPDLDRALAPPGRAAREVVLAGTGALFVIGGLDSGSSSTGRVWNVALPGGTTTRLAVLPQVLHDAAGAVLGGDLYVFGGGGATELATVQRYRAGGASVVGHLPQARSDLVAVAIGGTAYVLGGFDGSTSIASVLATTDGVTFRTVAQLPQTVRYPAVAVLDGRIWLFGGQHDGRAVSTIQRVDPAAGTAVVAGQLPAARSDASAVRPRAAHPRRRRSRRRLRERRAVGVRPRLRPYEHGRNASVPGRRCRRGGGRRGRLRRRR